MLSNMTEICTPIIRQYWTLIKNSTTSHLNANHNEINIQKKKTVRQNLNQELNKKKKRKENAKRENS